MEYSLNSYLDFHLLSLTSLISQDPPFQEIIDYAASVMDSSIIMTDPYSFILASSDNSDSNNAQWSECIKIGQYTMPKTIENGNILSASAQHGSGSIHCLYYSTTPSQTHRALLPYVTWLLFSSYNGNSSELFSPISEHSDFFHHLLQNNNGEIKHSDLSKRLGISALKQLQIITLCIPEGINLDFFLQRLQNLFKTDVIAPYQKYMVVLVPALEKEEYTALEHELRCLDFHIGLSFPFHNISDIMVYIHQAIAALCESVKLQDHVIIADYAEYLPYDIFSHYAGKWPLSKFRHPVLRTLSKNPSDPNFLLYETLRIYIEQSGNLSRTAQKLHLHRNSVVHRLRQICNLTKYDVTNVHSHKSLRYAFAIDRYLTQLDD